jgi:hypothetical protein
MYSDSLPDQCPPSDASDVEIPEAWRFARHSPPIAQDFLSHAALGKVNVAHDPCEWASCSLWTTKEGLLNVMKLSKPRNEKIVRLKIPFGSGSSKIKENGHVDFWCYAGFDFVAHLNPANDNNE